MGSWNFHPGLSDSKSPYYSPFLYIYLCNPGNHSLKLLESFLNFHLLLCTSGLIFPGMPERLSLGITRDTCASLVSWLTCYNSDSAPGHQSNSSNKRSKEGLTAREETVGFSWKSNKAMFWWAQSKAGPCPEELASAWIESRLRVLFPWKLQG